MRDLRRPLVLFALLFAAPACGSAESDPEAGGLRDGGATNPDFTDDGGPQVSNAAALTSGVLFIHGSYTLPALRFCLADDQKRAEPSEEQLAAGNIVGLDVTTARFVPGSRFTGAGGTVDAYDAVAVAELERRDAPADCASLKSALKAQHYELPVRNGATADTLSDPKTNTIVVAVEGCERVGFKAQGGFCSTPFKRLKENAGDTELPNAHVATFVLPSVIPGAIFVHAASGANYTDANGISQEAALTTVFTDENAVTGTPKFGEYSDISLNTALKEETFTLAAHVARKGRAGTLADVDLQSSAPAARAFVDPRTSAASYYSPANRAVFVVVGASPQRNLSGNTEEVILPANARAMQFAAVSIPTR